MKSVKDATDVRERGNICEDLCWSSWGVEAQPERRRELIPSRLQELYVGYSVTRRLFRRRRYICPGVYFARCYPALFPRKVKESKGAAGCRPTPEERCAARSVTTHCTRRIVSAGWSTEPSPAHLLLPIPNAATLFDVRGNLFLSTIIIPGPGIGIDR